MTTPVAATPRPYRGEIDLQPICDLMRACETVDHQEDWPDVEMLRDWFTSPGIEEARDFRLWEDVHGRLIGFAFVWTANEAQAEDPAAADRDPDHHATLDGYLTWRVHPEARDDEGVEGAITAWATERVQQEARERGWGAALYTRARESHVYAHRVLTAQGFAPARYYFRMGRDLHQPVPDLELPPGYTLRHVAADNDDEIAQWVDCFNQSFIDHWNHHPITVDDRKHWISDGDHRSEQDMILVAPDGTVAAFAYCAIHPKENAHSGRNEGWIQVLGTRRGYRKMGLGRAALVAGLLRLQADGADMAVLNVDSENPTGALGLYEGVGFVKQFNLINYCKELA